jgi:hypothetical protein
MTAVFLEFPFIDHFCTYALFTSFVGYGFVDFDNAQDAEKAVKALQAQGIQAQMAKV